MSTPHYIRLSRAVLRSLLAPNKKTSGGEGGVDALTKIESLQSLEQSHQIEIPTLIPWKHLHDPKGAAQLSWAHSKDWTNAELHVTKTY
ncbi:hypothetical protein FRX31_003170 [Thalictrum thalictroides]|uniref:Uncharacterized protein n=1 Tax=Thalictrum thalictroides TaxID=46969 RepID=A0A7J6XEF7_THATH|nr:hypothetical protein FRX31_003170 [Thalictrum thalictroides]